MCKKTAYHYLVLVQTDHLRFATVTLRNQVTTARQTTGLALRRAYIQGNCIFEKKAPSPVWAMSSTELGGGAYFETIRYIYNANFRGGGGDNMSGGDPMVPLPSPYSK